MSAPPTPLLDPARWQRHLFRGRWEETAHGTTVIEPATGAALTEVGLASADDVATSVQAAVAAQAEWLAVPPRERAEIFRRAASLFQQHFDELARMVARETGGVLFKGEHEVREAITLCHLAAGMPLQAQGQLLRLQRHAG